MKWLLAADPIGKIKISCEEIGNCSSKSPTLDAAFSNAATLIISLVGMLAIVFIIWGGIQFALSSGDSKKVQEAKSTLTYAVIGLVLSMLAYAVVAFVTTAVSSGTVR